LEFRARLHKLKGQAATMANQERNEGKVRVFHISFKNLEKISSKHID
jgi:hypothetical protein